MKSVIVRSLIAITAVVGLATPASAAVDLDVKRSIVEVVLDNLGVSASPELIISIAQDLDASELDAGLVTAVNNLLDTNADPRAIIESQTDANGDGVPDEGAALGVADDDTDSDVSENSGSNSGSNSGNNSGSNSNSNAGGSTDDGESVDETDDESDDGSDSEDSEDESEDEEDDD